MALERPTRRAGCERDRRWRPDRGEPLAAGIGTATAGRRCRAALRSAASAVRMRVEARSRRSTPSGVRRARSRFRRGWDPTKLRGLEQLVDRAGDDHVVALADERGGHGRAVERRRSVPRPGRWRRPVEHGAAEDARQRQRGVEDRELSPGRGAEPAGRWSGIGPSNALLLTQRNTHERRSGSNVGSNADEPDHAGLGLSSR